MRQKTVWLLALRCTAVVIAACNILIQAVGAQPVSKSYLTGGCDTPQTPFCDALMAPIPNWTGHVFHLSQDYPTAVGPDVQPWLQFDPKTQPDQYLNAALSYFFEGNIQADTELSFDPTLNNVRAWYNAPWQNVGTNGREFIHGLTRERVSRPQELGDDFIFESLSAVAPCLSVSFSQNRFPLLRDVLLRERHPHRDQAARLRDFLVGIAAAAIDAASTSFAIRSLVLGTPMPVTMS